MSTTTTSSTTTSPAGAKKPPHVLIFPYPAQGHTLPLLDLTHQLSLKNLNITIITTPKNLSTLSPLLSTHPNIQPLVFPFPSHPSLPEGVENVKELGNSGNLPIIVSLTKLYDPIIKWFRSQVNPPVALISDFFLGWTLRLADHINIPRFCFYSSGAFLASIVDYCWNHIDDVKYSEVFDFLDLPKTPSFYEKHLPSFFRFYDKSNPDWEVVKEGIFANTLSYGSVFNSFEALEGDYLGFLQKKMGHDHRVYGVGPLSLLGPNHSSRCNTDSGSFAHVFNWLDSCPDGSVVYVCFGSQKLMSNRQMVALANGLEMSMARFIWVVKTGSPKQEESGYGPVPDGFEERVAGRGLVIKGWAPQVMLLGHAAVGGFLSHCGWNSVLEGIVSDVLILGWPMEADQFVNERLLVDMGLAVRVCMGADAVPDSAELGKVIGESMNGAGYEQEKRKAKELKSKALDAVRDGGSSLRDLNELVHELWKLQAKQG